MTDQFEVLTVEIAKSYCEDPQTVDLARFKSIEVEAIEVLLRSPTDLDLSGLVDIPDEVLFRLCQHEKDLYIHKTELTDSAGDLALSERWFCQISEPEECYPIDIPLRSIGPKVASVLAKSERPSITIDELEVITPEVARELANSNSKFVFPDVSSISDETAEALAQFGSQFLGLLGVTQISD